jgi:hypothetical protein
VENLHNCRASWEAKEGVSEAFRGRTVWSGLVDVFRLDGHPEAHRAYAWEEPPDQEGGRPRIFAVLEAGPVKSAADAVRASIVQRERERRA